MGLFDGIKFPYLNTQELNLDWIMTRIKELMGFMPTDGDVGDILMRNSDGASWEPPTAVQVDIGGLPEDTQIMNNDELIFYDVSVQANRKIKPPNLLDSMCSDAYPFMDGTAAAGTSKKPARYDHVHPTDTSRAPASYFQNSNLKLDHGGTGADNAADARDNLGLGDVATEDIVPVSKGGTGATDVTTAQTNLGLNGKAFNTGISYVTGYELGDLVILHINTNANLSQATTGWYTYGTLPAGYRPATDVYFCAIEDIYSTSPVEMRVTSLGVVYAYFSANTNYRPYATVCYIKA